MSVRMTVLVLLLTVMLVPDLQAQRRPGKVVPARRAPEAVQVPGRLRPALQDSFCYATKPPLTQAPGYASFHGQIAVVTRQARGDNSPSVMIWDLTNQNHPDVPIGTPTSGTHPNAWNDPNLNLTPVAQTRSYHHPDWVRSKIGDVFGLTLDDQGNIYVAATHVYPSNKTGSSLVPPVGSASPGFGDIYKIDRNSGAVTRFVETDPVATYSSASGKIPNTGAGLGNLHFDAVHQNLFVANVEDGLIYRISPSGTILSTWDHGAHLTPAVPDGQTNGATELGRRVFAVATYDNRLYYSVWREDQGHPDPSAGNEIWSILLSPSGDFAGNSQLEITLPVLGAFPYSNPVTDISFSSNGTMYVAERSMMDATVPTAHRSRLLEYHRMGTTWNPEPLAKFKVGGASGINSAGGVGLDSQTGGRIWATGDALVLSGGYSVYGIQGLPSIGGNVNTSILIDQDGDVSYQDKRFIGDVEIPCLRGDRPPPPRRDVEIEKTALNPPWTVGGTGLFEIQVNVKSGSLMPGDVVDDFPGAYTIVSATGSPGSWTCKPGTNHTVCTYNGPATTATQTITVKVNVPDGPGKYENCAGLHFEDSNLENNRTCTTVTVREPPTTSTEFDPCCPPMDLGMLQGLFGLDWQGQAQNQPFGFQDPYTWTYTQSSSFNTLIAAYLTYLQLATNGGITDLEIKFDLWDSGTSSPNPTTLLESSTRTWNYQTGSPTGPSFFSGYPLQWNHWYTIRAVFTVKGPNGPVDIYLETCEPIAWDFNFQVQPRKKRDGTVENVPVFRMRQPSGRIIERPVNEILSELRQRRRQN